MGYILFNVQRYPLHIYSEVSVMIHENFPTLTKISEELQKAEKAQEVLEELWNIIGPYDDRDMGLFTSHVLPVRGYNN